MRRRQTRRGEQGFSLFEVLLAVLLISIVSLGLVANTIGSLRIVKKTTTNYSASNLALSKIEELAAFDPADIDDDFDGVEPALELPGLQMTFRRQTNVTVNADGTRQVDVIVTSNSTAVPTTAKFSTTFALWE